MRELKGESLSVGELAARFTVGTPAISKHLTVLENAGLLSRSKEAQWRYCTLEGESFARIHEWLSHYASLWAGRVARIDDLLRDELLDESSAPGSTDADPAPAQHPTERNDHADTDL